MSAFGIIEVSFTESRVQCSTEISLIANRAFSLLKERRILFTGKQLGRLSSCVFATSALLYPMHWQNLFVPVLPVGLVDMLM